MLYEWDKVSDLLKERADAFHTSEVRIDVSDSVFPFNYTVQWMSPAEESESLDRYPRLFSKWDAVDIEIRRELLDTGKAVVSRGTISKLYSVA